MAWLPDGKFFKIYVYSQLTNVTDGQTTPHDDIGRACIASRGKNRDWGTQVIAIGGWILSSLRETTAHSGCYNA